MESFEAKPGIHCNFCAYRSLCPEKEKRIPHPVESYRRSAPNLKLADAERIPVHKNLGDALERPLFTSY